MSNFQFFDLDLRFEFRDLKNLEMPDFRKNLVSWEKIKRSASMPVEE